MANVLEFAIGLETGDFIKKVVSAEAVLGGLKKMAEGVEFVFHKMEQSIERAAGLEMLHKRTGESVGTLYRLQEAFKAVGLSGDGVPTMILRIQKTLGGFNEMGEKTDGILDALGIDMDMLAKQDAATQIQKISDALSKLSKGEAVGVASKLFGRFAAGDVLQIARSGEAFDEALKKAQRFAGLYATLAPLAEKYDRTISYTKMQWDAIWSTVALQLLPVLQQVLDKIQQLNIAKFAEHVGEAVQAIRQAFAEGKITDLMSAGFEAAVEKLGNIISGMLGSGDFWRGIFNVMVGEFEIEWATIAKMFLMLGNILKSAMEEAVQLLFQGLGKIPRVGEKLGLKGFQAEKFSDIFERNKSATDDAAKVLGINALQHHGVETVKKGVELQRKALVDAYLNSSGPAQDYFSSLIQGFISRAPKTAAGEAPGGGQDNIGIEPEKTRYKPEATKFEKMGFVMGGLGNPLTDFARRTAMATERIANHLATQQPHGDLPDKLVNAI